MCRICRIHKAVQYYLNINCQWNIKFKFKRTRRTTKWMLLKTTNILVHFSREEKVGVTGFMKKWFSGWSKSNHKCV